MKMFTKKAIALMLLSTAVGCGGGGSSSPNSTEAAKGRGDGQFGEVKFLDAVEARMGAADITFYFFDVCQVGQDRSCQELAYIVNNKNKSEMVVANPPRWPSDRVELTPSLNEIRARYQAQQKEWPKASRVFALDVDDFRDQILATNYINLKRCRSHPRWNEFVDIATSERSAVYLTITAAGPEEDDLALRDPAPGALRIDVTSGEFSWTQDVEGNYRFRSLGQIVLNSGLLNKQKEMIRDNLFLTFDVFQSQCDLGYEGAPDDDALATTYGFYTSVYLHGDDPSKWSEPTYSNPYGEDQLFNRWVIDPKEDPRCTNMEVTDYETRFFPNLKLKANAERTYRK